MVIMAIVFLLPAIAAGIVFNFFPELIKSMGASNNGAIVNPPVKINVDGLRMLDGKPLPASYLGKKWTYVHLEKSGCDETCILSLYNTRQVRNSQGREVHRLQRLLVVTDSENVEKLKLNIRKNHPDITIVTIAPGTLDRFVRQFDFKKVSALGARRTYIVDPVGQLMMVYEPEKVKNMRDAVRGVEMLKDMRKLLHNSKAVNK